MNATDDEIMAVYGKLDEARKQQILNYRLELADKHRKELAKEQREEGPA